MERKTNSTDIQANSQSVTDSAAQAIGAVRRIVASVNELHRHDQFHGHLVFDELFPSGADGALVEVPPPNEIVLGGTASDMELCPPEFRGRKALRLPTSITQAKTLLTVAGVASDPVRIDIYQLAVVLLHLHGLCTLQEYLSSPRAKASVPTHLRKIVDRALGHSLQNRIQTVGELLAELDAALEETGTKSTASVQSKPAKGDTASVIRASTMKDTSIAEHSRSNRREAKQLPFRQLGHYQVLETIGHGGMGDVYLGVDPQLDRKVALKVLPAEFARSTGFVERFRHEAASAARLSHANIVQIYFAGEDDGQFYFAMQYVDGESLAELLRRRKRLTSQQCILLLRQILSGLAHAHELAMVHRDVKPGNLLIDHGLRRAMIGDFGLVKSLHGAQDLTATGMVMGTAEYISPEQGQGSSVDHRTDQYSLGVVAFQALAGRLPFTADHHSALIYKHIYEPLPPLAKLAPAAPEALVAIVSRMLEKDPAQRFPDCDSVIQALASLVADDPTTSELFTAAGSDSDVKGVAQPAPSPAVSQVVFAPQFPAAPVVPPEMSVAEKPGFVVRAKQRAYSMLGRIAPPIRERLADTQQQLDGVVQEYERRHSVLVGHLQDAEAAVALMREQLADWRKQENDLAGSSSAKVAPERAAQRQLQEEIDVQSSELEDMRLQVSQVAAKLEEYRNQRDLLGARLEVARAQAGVFNDGPGRVLPYKSWFKHAATLAKLAVVIAVGGGIAWMLLNKSTPPNPLPRYTNIRTGQPPGTAGRFTAANLHGPEIDLEFDATCIAVSPRKLNPAYPQFAFGASDGTVYVASYHLIAPHTFRTHKLLGHQESIDTICYSRDGEYLATADGKGEIRIWDPNDRVQPERRVLLGHERKVDLLRFSDDAKKLLSAGGDSTIRVWDVIHERELEKIQRKPSQRLVVHSATPDGRFLHAPKLANPIAAGFWSMRDTTDLSFVGSDLQKTSFLFESPAAFEDSVRAMYRNSASQAAVRVQEPGKAPESIATHVRLAALSQDRKVALTVHEDKSLAAWNLVGQFESVKIVDPANGNDKTPEDWHTSSAAIFGENRYAATISSDNGLQVWDLPEFEIQNQEFEIHRFQTEGIPAEVAFGMRGRIIAAATGDGINQWELDTRFVRNTSLGAGQKTTALIRNKDGSAYLFGVGGPEAKEQVAVLQYLPAPPIFGYRRRPVHRYFGHSDSISAVAFFKRETQIVTASRDGTVKFWDVETRQVLDSLELDIPVNSIAVDPDEQLLLVATENPEIKVYDLTDLSELDSLTAHDAAVLDIRWSRNGQEFVSASRDGTVRAWKRDSMDVSHVFKGHEGPVHSAAILSHMAAVVSGGEDRTVRLWKPSSDNTVVFRGHESAVVGVDISPSGAKAVSGSRDGTVRVWDLLVTPDYPDSSAPAQ